MFYIPLLSIAVFLGSFLPMLYLGYKKGWRYALIFSGILFTLIAIFSGINILLYKPLLWKIYKNSFLTSNSSSLSIDYDILAKYYKARIILFTLLVEFLPMLIINFIIMHFIALKWTSKFLGPKVQKKSESESDIIVVRNIKKNKLLGLATISVTSLFSSALLASGVNVLVTPYDKANSVTKATDILSYIYTMSLANNDKTPQVMNKFLKSFSGHSQQQLLELINFNASEKNPNQFNDVENLNELLNSPLMKELLKEEEASKGLFDSLINTNSTLDPLALQEDVINNNKDINDNRTGYNKTNGEKSINDLIDFLNIHKISIRLPKMVRTLLLAKFANIFIDYSDTLFAKQKEISISNKTEAERKLKEKQIRLSEVKRLIVNFIRERIATLESMQEMSGDVIKGDWNNTNSITVDRKSINRENKGNGKFSKNVTQEEHLKSIFDDKQAEYQKSTIVYNDYFNNEYSPIEREYKEAKRNWENLLRDIERTEIDIKNQRSSINNLENENQRHRKEITSKTSIIDKIAKIISSLNSQIKTSRDKSDNLANVIETISGNIRDINNEIENIENQIKNAGASTDENKTTIANLERDLKNKREELSDAKRLLEQKENQKKSFDIKLDELNNRIRDEESRKKQTEDSVDRLKETINHNITIITTFQNQLRNYENELGDFNNQKPNLNEIMIKSKRVFDLKQSQLNAYEQEMQKSLSASNIASQNYYRQKDIVDNSINEYSKNVDDINKINTELQERQHEQDVLENKVNSDTFDFAVAKTWSYSDNGSILYSKRHLDFLQEKVSQVTKIYDDKKHEYNLSKKHLSDIYSKWLNKEVI